MPIYLVTYDLSRELTRLDYAKIYAVRDTYDYVRLSESSYAIDTTESPDAVLSKFRQALDANDGLYLVTLSRPWTGQGRSEADAWLTQKLGGKVRSLRLPLVSDAPPARRAARPVPPRPARGGPVLPPDYRRK